MEAKSLNAFICKKPIALIQLLLGKSILCLYWISYYPVPLLSFSGVIAQAHYLRDSCASLKKRNVGYIIEVYYRTKLPCLPEFLFWGVIGSDHYSLSCYTCLF